MTALQNFPENILSVKMKNDRNGASEQQQREASDYGHFISVPHEK
jgi:hypothetical protein